MPQILSFYLGNAISFEFIKIKKRISSLVTVDWQRNRSKVFTCLFLLFIDFDVAWWCLANRTMYLRMRYWYIYLISCLLLLRLLLIPLESWRSLSCLLLFLFFIVFCNSLRYFRLSFRFLNLRSFALFTWFIYY